MDEMRLQAAILVGGRGTRLGSLTDSIPKAMVEVAGRPFLDWLIEEVARFPIPRITLLAGSLGQTIVECYHGRMIGGAHIEVLVEPEPLGTAGVMRHFSAHLEERFLLLHGDTRFDVNLLDLALHSKDALATLALRRGVPGERCGTVEMDRGGRILGFAARSARRTGPINGGIYLMRRDVLEHVPLGTVSLELDVFPRLAAEGLLRGALYDGAFIDIGIPGDLAAAHTIIPAMARRPAVFLDRDGVLIEDTGWPHKPEEARWIAGAAAAVKRLNDAGYLVFVVTNQAGVAKGFYPEAQVGVMHEWMAGELAAAGAHVDAWEYCPNHPEAVIAQYRIDCTRRKPKPGMLTDLLARWPVDQSRSFLIGDRDTDMAAAEAAGLPGYRFPGGNLNTFLSSLLPA